MSNSHNFQISDSVLRRTCELNNFDIEVKGDEMILFGVRGALPASMSSSLLDYSQHLEFRESHLLQRVRVNYYYPRCILGQWLPSERKVAVFPGSTIPNLKVVQRNRKRKHQFNCMLAGFYQYSKGQHPRSDSGYQPHRALRLGSSVSLRRANYTTVNAQPVINYGPEADIQVGNPGDNIHCARNNPRTTRIEHLKGTDFSVRFCMSDYYSSYGCQVIVGCPKQYIPSNQENGSWNAWDKFITNVYDEISSDQNNFKYILLESAEVKTAFDANSSDPHQLKVRHGSTGWLVESLQQKLFNLRNSQDGQRYYSDSVDGDFGAKTARALINFQKDVMNNRAYGFAGKDTFRLLGISLSAVTN